MKIGRGTIYKNGKYYACRYWINNEQKYRGGFKTKGEAEAFLGEIATKKKNAEPIPTDAHKLTVNQLLDSVISYNTIIKPLKSIRDKENRKDNLLTFFNGWKVSQVTPSSIDDYVGFRKRQGISNSTINRELDVLKSAFNLAIRKGKVASKPYFEKLEEPKARKVTFKKNEIPVFREALPEDCRAVFDFQLEIGCRISEVVTLRWLQVDFENGVVIWEETKTPRPDSPDSNSSKVYPFSNRLREILIEQRKIVDALQKELHKIIPYVFPRLEPKQVRGTSMFYYDKWQQREKTSKWFYDRWNAALKTAKLTDRITHDLRLGGAIRRDEAGVSVDSNMRLGGWRTPKMLTRYLEGKDLTELRAAVAKTESEQKAKPSQNAGSTVTKDQK